MKAFLAGAVLVVAGCGGATSLGDSDAATRAPAEQQLKDLLPNWCPQICSKLVQCGKAETSSSACASECNTEMAQQFGGQGDACAQIGLDFMSCIENSPCTVAATPQSCDPDSTKLAALCPRTSDSSTTVPVSGTTSPPPNTSNSVVVCNSGSGMAPTPQSPIGTLVCDSSESNCSDGHTYRLTCTNQGNNTVYCTCYVDGNAVAPFTSAGSACPSAAVVNASCGWQLSNFN